MSQEQDKVAETNGEDIEREITPAMKAAVWSFFGKIWGPHGRIISNWNKTHFVAEVFPNSPNVVYSVMSY